MQPLTIDCKPLRRVASLLLLRVLFLLLPLCVLLSVAQTDGLGCCNRVVDLRLPHMPRRAGLTLSNVVVLDAICASNLRLVRD